MKRIKSSFVGVLALFAASLLVGYFAKSQSLGPPTLKPFVAYQSEKKFGPDGQLKAVFDWIVVHREDGSYMESFSTTSPAGESGVVLSIVDAQAQTLVRTEPFTKSKTTLHLSNHELIERTQERKACEDPQTKEQVGKSIPSVKLLNQKIALVTTTLGSGPRSVTRQSLVAPQLDCYPLARTEFFPSGARNERRLEKLDIGAPPPSLFEVPAGYTERSPAQTEALYRAQYAGVELFKDDALARLERDYWAHQKR